MEGRKKRILIVCGSGIVTSTIAHRAVEKVLDEGGYKGMYEITQSSHGNAAEMSKNYDFMVTTSVAPAIAHCPVVMGMCYLMGMNTEESDRQILELMAAE